MSAASFRFVLSDVEAILQVEIEEMLNSGWISSDPQTCQACGYAIKAEVTSYVR